VLQQLDEVADARAARRLVPVRERRRLGALEIVSWRWHAAIVHLQARIVPATTSRAYCSAIAA
jgi:hypothetical protein